jgi:type I restriction enzyme S subunit
MFIEHSGRQITPEGLAGCSATVFPAGSVMMTSRATLGVVAINVEPACTNQGFITCVPNERVSAAHLYFWTKSNLPLIESLASGATFKEITKRAFREIEFLIPSHDLRRAFVSVVEPMLSLIANLIRQNANLRTTRDLLLPKLVAGKIDVSDLDIDTEWLAS